MLKKSIWSAIETALFYYSGDMYNWSSLVHMNPRELPLENPREAKKENFTEA
jgi:hypothetical protein